MCFTADHKSCVNQVHYIYVHRYIFMSLCSTWPCFMYVKPPVVASILDYFRRLSAPFHSCVRENRFTALGFHTPSPPLTTTTLLSVQAVCRSGQQ